MALPDGVSEILPLTSAQTGMLFHVLENPSAQGPYVAVLSCTLDGPVESERLREAMQAEVQSRDAYRAGFVWEGVKRPVQVVLKNVDLPWRTLDWRGQADRDTRLADLISEEQLRQFDLNRAPLMMVTLIRLSDNRWQLVWTIHHLVSDGWSTSIVFDNVFNRYYGRSDPALKQASFRDYVAWLRRSAPLTDTAFWQAHLAGLDGPSLLTEQPPAQDSVEGHRHLMRHLGAETLERANSLAKRFGMTTNTVLSATWALVLRRLLQHDDVVFGQTSAGRPAEIPGIARAAGAFINTLPLRVKIDPAQSGAAFLANVAETQRQCTPHAFASLAEVQSCAPIPKGSALFDTLFVNEGTATQARDFCDIKLSNLTTVQTSNYALALLATPNDDFKVELYFDPAKVGSKQAERCLTDFETTLHALITSPNTPVRDLCWHNVDPIAVPLANSYLNVLDRFLAQATANPDAIAVSDVDTSLTYAALLHRARQVAATLAGKGVTAQEIVPVALPRSTDAIAAFLGVMMVGAAYVPIDISYPSQRIAQILDRVKPRFVITTVQTFDLLPPTHATPVHMETLDGPLDPAAIQAGETAYVIFTSGSQGQPKGVEITHAALAHSTGARDEVYNETPEVFLLLSSLAFDSSVAGMYWALATGGHLVIAPSGAEQEPARLGALITQHRVTHTLCLPSLAQALVQTLTTRDLASLRMLIAAGEALPNGLIETCREKLPLCRVINEYGPTEATVWCAARDVTAHKGSNSVPIGCGLPGTWIGVCNQDGVPLPAGRVGEIVVVGPTLATGYLNDPEQTRLSFSRLGPDGPRAYRTGDLGRMDVTGDITFLGRRDAQFKIRGHRVELSEIEKVARSVLAQTDLVALAVDQDGRIAIHLFVEHVQDDELRNHIQSKIEVELPAPFHPSQIVFVPSFPRLPNGKVDRARLHDLLPNTADGEAPNDNLPQTEVEQQVADLFAQVLGTPALPRDAHFFDLGGDSLMTLAVYAKARDQGLSFDPIDIFNHPTIQGLARHILAGSGSPHSHEGLAELRLANIGGQDVAFFLVHGTMQLFLQTARGLGKNHPVGMLFSHHLFDRKLPYTSSIAGLAAEAIEGLRSLRAHGPYVLGAYSAACPIVLEMLQQLGPGEVVKIVLIDPPYLVVGADPSLQSSRASKIKRMQNRFRLSLRIARHSLRAPFFSAGLRLFPDNDWMRRNTVRSAYAFALSRYRVPRHDGPTQVFVTGDNPAMAVGDVMDTHLTNKSVEHLPMGHNQIIASPEGVVAITSRIVAICRAAK